MVEELRASGRTQFKGDSNTQDYARKLDEQDHLSGLREQFVLPTKGSLKKKALDGSIPSKSPPVPSGNGCLLILPLRRHKQADTTHKWYKRSQRPQQQRQI